MNKQTAVEWLYNHLFPKQLDGFSDEEWEKIDKGFEQAKEMESQQHSAIYNEGLKKSEGMITFLYTEVEGRIDALQNGRHKD